MRTGKRTLAGLAAGALAAGLIPFVAASSAQAAEVTASVSPVRVAGVAGTSLESVPWAEVAWVPAATINAGDTARITSLTTYPSASAKVAIDAGANVGDATNGYTVVASGAFSGEDTATPTSPTSAVAGQIIATGGGYAWIGIAADTAGSYSGVMTLYSGGVATGQTVKFAFTTTGAPKSMTLSPATASAAVSGTADFDVTLLDAAGNATQPLKVDGVGFTVSGGTAPADLTAADLYAGTKTVTYTAPASAGSYTLTAAPGGTLSAGGVTAQTSTITVSGAISDDTVTNLTVSTPASAVNSGTIAAGDRAAKVQAGTASITVTVTSVSNAGKTIRLKGVSSAGTPTSTAPEYQTVAIDANGAGTATFTVGGAGLAATANLTISQVKANGDPIYSGANAADIVVTQTAPVIVADSVTLSPSGSLVKKLGETTDVTVTVKTEFGAPVSNIPVSWVRAATYTGTVQQTVVTNASGEAVLTLSPAAGIVSGTTEQYSVRVVAPTTGNIDKDAAVTIQYTTGGNVDSVTVTVPNIAGATQPITQSSTPESLLAIPAVEVPYSGTLNTTTESGAYYTKATTVTSGTIRNFVEFRANPSPANTVTVTVPEGLKVFNGTEKAAGVAWNGGSLTGTFDANEAIYVFGTKAGTHDVTFTSGGVTTTAQVRVATDAEAAYNVAISPATQDIVKLGFGNATVTVTDIFGNPVTTDADHSVTVTASGAVLLGGQTGSTTVTTGADGTATVTVLAGAVAGDGALKVTPSNAAVTYANGAATTRPWSSAGYVVPTGATAPVKEATAAVKVIDSSAQSIVIAGERAVLDDGRKGVKVTGTTTGYTEGTRFTVWYHFQGETYEDYRPGVSRPTDAEGKFRWQRATNKKIYIYFVGPNGEQSNKLTIPKTSG